MATNSVTKFTTCCKNDNFCVCGCEFLGYFCDEICEEKIGQSLQEKRLFLTESQKWKFI